jgi:hypothetical protein
LILLGVAMGLVLAAQINVRAERKTGSPVAKFFAGGYWFDSLTPRGRILLGAGYLLAVIALFVVLSHRGGV